MAGFPVPRKPWDPLPKPTLPTSQYGDPATFTAAANQQASDYDKIMAQYDDLVKSFSSNPLTAGVASYKDIPNQAPISASSVNFNPVSAPTPINFQQVSPQTTQYVQSGDVTKSLSDLSNLVDTGGYSEADKQNIRERDISPIRSIYANAQQDAERQRALSGGYSPNFNAVIGRMAREQADKIGATTTAANAGIAQNVASNKLSAAPSYASASANANAAKTAADLRNAEIINQANQFNSQGVLNANEFNSSGELDANKFNSQGMLGASSANAANDLSVSQFNTSMKNAINQANASNAMNTNQFNIQAALDAAKANKSGIFGALQGKTSLYGTTPALTKTFGDQTAQAASLGQNQQQLNKQKLDLFGRPSTSFG